MWTKPALLKYVMQVQKNKAHLQGVPKGVTQAAKWKVVCAEVKPLLLQADPTLADNEKLEDAIKKSKCCNGDRRKKEKTRRIFNRK